MSAPIPEVPVSDEPTDPPSRPTAEPISPATPGRGGAFTPPGGGPSPLPVMTLLLVSALLAAVGIILVARSGAPAVGWVLVALGVVGAIAGVGYALRNVRQARTVERETRRSRSDEDDKPLL